MSSLRDRALARRGVRKSASIPLPWGDNGALIPVYVRGISAAERDAWEGGVSKRRAAGTLHENFRASLVVLSVTDENGVRLYTDSKEDLQAAGEIPADELSKLYDAATKINGLTEEDKKDIEGNSKSEPAGS
jgi:hypothetical protein